MTDKAEAGEALNLPLVAACIKVAQGVTQTATSAEMSITDLALDVVNIPQTWDLWHDSNLML